MRKTFRDMMKSVALHCVAAGAVLTVLSMASCKQGHVPNAQLPELRNDTGKESRRSAAGCPDPAT